MVVVVWNKGPGSAPVTIVPVRWLDNLSLPPRLPIEAMKDTLTDANFPRTTDLRVYHLGLRPGEVANRLITVGSPSRAHTIASYLDVTPNPFQLSSERGFLTITGRYKRVPVSIVSIGMGAPNMDFFVREVRECLVGDMLVVRLGSCGGLIHVPVGTVVVPKACISVTRNVDFDFVNPEENDDVPYKISKPVYADPEFHDVVHQALESVKPSGSTIPIVAGITNASADSFYSSQGRQTSFPDNNETLIEQIIASTSDVATLEMETHHLYHLAECWSKKRKVAKVSEAALPPLSTGPVKPVASSDKATGTSTETSALAAPDTVIRAAAAQMVFASRTSQDFITPQQVQDTERWTGKGVLEALIRMELAADRVHPDEGSVWAL
ncbi:nucleoside phosphorylase domain-containing protein [Armillaria luteobubalina]|uniref:Nucleoside phosphorylase domain-containing protein n=1 Tax=Armillaria luteobubalina TaxID=153913 RepID=A0AA39URN9_9AGAR|nr:nucleoside phosphorylase domain-containing protein [Armillaria luteobubalina]